MSLSSVLIVSGYQWYPFEEVIQSVTPVSDEIVVNADAGSGAVAFVESLQRKYPIRLLKSAWNWKAKDKGQELARQTNLAIEEARCEWILDVQADEVLHEAEHARLLDYIRNAPQDISGFKLSRLYFFERPDIVRADWTMSLTRLFRRGSHIVVGDAMDTRTIWGKVAPAYGLRLFHYSRLAPPNEIVDRIMNLSTLFHDESTLRRPDTYEFETFAYDSFSTDNPPPAVDRDEVLVSFTETHPRYIRAWLVKQLQQKTGSTS